MHVTQQDLLELSWSHNQMVGIGTKRAVNAIVFGEF